MPGCTAAAVTPAGPQRRASSRVNSTFFTAELASCALLRQRRPVAGLLARLLPPVVASALLLRRAPGQLRTANSVAPTARKPRICTRPSRRHVPGGSSRRRAASKFRCAVSRPSRARSRCEAVAGSRLRSLPLRGWVPGQERFDERSEARSFLEQEPMPGIGVEHQPCPGDEAGEGVVIGDRVEPVGGAVGDKRGH